MNTLDTYKELQDKYTLYLKRATQHLAYSLNKSKSLPKKLEDNSEDSLESWEGLTTRFARVIDIFLTKHIKVIVKGEDPIFDGSLRDYLNLAEKRGLIRDVDHWLSLRVLRNIQAHDYNDTTFAKFITAVQVESAFVLAELKKLGLYEAK